MRTTLVTTAMIAVLSATTGCFTVLGGVIGSAGDGPPKQRAKLLPRHAPNGAPPGSDYFAAQPPPPPEDSGMSGGSKGLLVGAAIDALLVVGMVVAIENMDWGFDDHWGCPDSGCDGY